MEITEIKQQIRAIFDPLASSLGMRGPIERDLFQYAEFKLGYLTDEIGIQIDVTLMSFFIFQLLFRPKGNSIPIGYEDETGALQKLHLQDALEHLGIDSTKVTKELRELQGDSHNCSKMAEILARLLKEHWPTIRSTPDLWLLLDSRTKERQHLAQRKKAEIAWREKNYAQLIMLYEAEKILLSPEEKSRLEYEESKCGNESECIVQ